MYLFKKQGWHLAFLIVTIPILMWVIRQPAFSKGTYWGLSTTFWYWAAIVVAVAHQVFVWLSWRLQLNYQIYDQVFGKAGFGIYALKFQVLFWGRFALIIFLAISNAGTTAMPPAVAFTLIILLGLPVLLTFLSVIVYFGLSRAMGIDHFKSNYRNIPLVRAGMFKFSSNAMYTFATLALFIPGLFWLSSSALIAGLFQYLYLWVHYFCTEKPDMEYIYGDAGTNA